MGYIIKSTKDFVEDISTFHRITHLLYNTRPPLGFSQAPRESDEVRADTEGGTLSRRNTHARADGVQDRKDDRR